MNRTICISAVSTPKQIERSPLNNSRSKQLFSFSKSNRFPKMNPSCHEVSYLPALATLSPKKGAGIGYGSKMNWTKDPSCAPGVSKYHLDSFVEENRTRNKGYSLALSRSQIPSKGYIPLQPLRSPSPQHYQMNDKVLKRSPLYTMRPQTKIIDKSMSIASQNNNPPPGRYANPEEMSSTGHYPTSKHKNFSMLPFSKRSSPRFQPPNKLSPGPANYFQISHEHQATSQSMLPKEKRESLFQYNARKDYRPGPGSYRHPSEFGHYDEGLQHLKRNKEGKQK